MIAVTAALAVLLAVLFHLGVAAVVVAILGTVPALYLAWAALPGAANGTGFWPSCGAVGSGGTGRAPGDRRRPDAGIHPEAAR